MLEKYHNEVKTICEEINMPEEVTQKILENLNNYDFSGITDNFTDLLDHKTGSKAVRNVEKILKTDNDSLKPLAVYLSAAVKTWERYDELHISREIFVDTMQMFSRFVREHFETFGFYGFDRDFWIYRILSLSLFRLGTLEFEMTVCSKNENLADYAKEGEKVISVHIPSDAVMTRENLAHSYAGIKEFLARWFPAYKDAVIYCKTWLLDPALRDLLPLGSKILNFQSDYRILDISYGDKGFMTWVFKKKYDDLAMLPENTTLQKNLKKLLQSGGGVGLVTGILEDSLRR